jgi:hypothetical protein
MGQDPLVFGATAALLLGAAIAWAALRPESVLAHPRTTLSLLAGVTAVALLVLLRVDPPGIRLHIDPSTEALLPSGDAGLDVYRSAVVDFGDDEVFVIAMQTDEVFRQESLAALRRVSDRLSRIAGVRAVQSLVDVTSFRFVPAQDWIEVRPFIEEIPSALLELSQLRERALRDPVYRRNLVSSDARTAALNVSFRKMSDRDFIAADLDGRVRAILDAETTAERRFFVSGRPHIKSRMYAAMTDDLLRLIPIALVVVSAVLAVISGSVRGVVLPMATVAMAVIWTFGAIAWLERPLTVLTVLLAPTLVAVGSVYGVHLVNRYDEEAAASGARGGGDRASVVRSCQRHMIVPVLIAGLTTAIGFAALGVSDVPAVVEIGAFSVLGVASVTAVSLSGIPAALALMPLRGRRRFAFASRMDAALDAGLAWLARATQRRRRAVLVAAGGISALAAVLIPHIEIDTDYLSYFDSDAPVRLEFDQVNRLLAGAVPLFVVVDAAQPGDLREPSALQAVEALQQRLDAVPGVSRTLSVVDSLRVLNRAVSGDLPQAERIPESRAAVTELLFMLPKGDAQRFLTLDHSRANLIVRTGEVGSAAMRALSDGIQQAIDAQSLPAGLRVQVTGNALLLNRAADSVAVRQPLSVGFAAATIFVLLAFGLRSVRLGWVAMIPNVIPVLVFFGVLGTGISPLSLPTSLIGSVALGIAIDATAHYVVRYRAERLSGASPAESVERCSRGVGRAVAIATVMLTFGFLSVTFSGFAPLREFGFLSALTMAICGVTDLVLLPALLLTFDAEDPTPG